MIEQYAYQVLQLALQRPEEIWQLYQTHGKGQITNDELWEAIDELLLIYGG